MRFSQNDLHSIVLLSLFHKSFLKLIRHAIIPSPRKKSKLEKKKETFLEL